MFDKTFPPDSAQPVYYLAESNLWMDEDGEIYLDLTEFGFTALQRETLLMDMHKNYDAEYMYVTNYYGEPVEIHWERR
jgi:hypothetical protein